MRERTASRFSTGTNQNGLFVDASLQPLSVYERLLTERAAQAEPVAEAIEMQLKRIAPVEAGGLALVDLAQPVTFVPSGRTSISGKFRKRETRGWHFLDRFFAGESEWRESRDEDVWHAALEAAQDASFGSAADGVRGDSGALLETRRPAARPALTRGLWSLSRLVAVALVHRRGGVHVTVADLPTV